MRETLITNDVDLLTTFKCNWDCEYCIVDTHRQPEITTEMLMKKVDSIEPNSIVKLFGGEPGMLSKKVVKEVIEKLEAKNCELMLSTNGLFMERHYEYCDRFVNILYHCSEDLDEEDHNFKRYPEFEEIEYQLTVTDNNYHKLEAFLDANKDIKFSVFGATSNPIPVIGNTLAKRKTLEIMMKHKDRLNKKCWKNLFSHCDKISESL